MHFNFCITCFQLASMQVAQGPREITQNFNKSLRQASKMQLVLDDMRNDASVDRAEAAQLGHITGTETQQTHERTKTCLASIVRVKRRLLAVVLLPSQFPHWREK